MKSKSIRNVVVAASLAALAAACARDNDNEAGVAAAARDGAQSQAMVDGVSPGAPGRRATDLPRIGRSLQHSFASVPDRGDLVAYPKERVVRRAGPYTWHRADFSEAHALRAIVDGVLTFTTPSGEQLRFEYDRHVEHDSGDWTWIGHVVGGGTAQDAILTFGADAVFGSIAQPGKVPLNLTIEDGVSWLVETDAAARAAQAKASGRYSRPDFLLPPEIAVVDGLQAQASAARASAAASAASTVVDVLVGYTDGFAAEWTTSAGNRGPIATRLNFLVDVTNESYVNSQVDVEVRIVHSMQVAYIDANDNSEALRALTGSDGTQTPTLAEVDPALQPLHAARDQYGADLVSLVRDFVHPEAVSCGVAWLLGGGQSLLHEGYEIYGMSVVSDGSDGGFFCEDTTFAHELGHNMGLAHDVETAKGEDGVLDDEDYGRYAYSFGYKSAAGNFFTVMAYGDEGQTGYRVFSNPDVTICGGLPCGVEGQTDNALTLRQTVGIIASFRDTVVPVETGMVRADFNGDGISDLLWRNSEDGRNSIWLSADASVQQAAARVAKLSWRVVGTGDFDGDGTADVLWRNDQDGRNVVWQAGNADTSLELVRVANLAYIVAGVGDFDGDGRDDILWRNTSDGRNVIWKSADESTQQAVARVTKLSWEVAGADDFDGDGRDDILWRNTEDGRNSIWNAADAGDTRSIARVAKQSYIVAGTGDFDGDGTADVLWRNTADGRNAIWKGGDATVQQPISRVAKLSYIVAAVGDYDGDGLSDIAWRDTSDGRNVIWKAADSSNEQAVATVAALAWEIVP